MENLNSTKFPGNKLMPIVGNGKMNRPKIMFVFINPTARNISSSEGWSGPRFPFVGTKQVWRIFYRAGLFDEGLIDRINKSTVWTVDFSNEILEFLKSREFYLTNIVKWTGKDAALPDSRKVKLFLPILEKEIELVKPLYIVAFGLIPFENLTKNKIRLSNYYDEAIKSEKLNTYPIKINHFKAKVIPCYFPIGRGNPKRAVELLRLVNNLQMRV